MAERRIPMFLEMKNIRKHYGEGENRVEVLKGIDIEIEKGEDLRFTCPSGSCDYVKIRLS